MTAWTRIGIAAIAVLTLSATALAPGALVRTSAAAERALSDAQLKKINGWIADQGEDGNGGDPDPSPGRHGNVLL